MIKFLFFLFLFPSLVYANVKSYDLKALLSFVENSNLELQTEKFIDKINDAEYKRIMKEFNPKLKLMFGAGPITKQTGDAIRSQIDYTSWGVAWLGEAELMWPLYQWGRMKNLLTAMKHKIKLDSQQIALKRNEIIYNLKEVYYQALYTHSLLDFVNDVLEKVGSKRDDKKTKKVAKYQLDVLHAQLKGRKEDILKGQRLAYLAIKLYSGIEEEEFTLDKDYIEKKKRKLEDFDYYWKLALENKPEFIQSREGLQAKEKYLRAQETELYPLIGVMVNYEYSSAQITEEQQSIFAYDPYNRNDFSLGVGLLWNYDFGVTNENIRKTGAELDQLRTRKRYADIGLKVKVRKAWEEVFTAENKVKLARKGYKSGKKWVNRLASSWAMGLTPTQRLVEAFQMFSFASKDYFDSMLQQHLTWANLSREVGVEVDPLLTKN